MARQKTLFEILAGHEADLRHLKGALSRIPTTTALDGAYLKLSGGVLTGTVDFTNSFANPGGNIRAYDVTGREILLIEGGNGSLTDARLQIYGASDSTLPNQIHLYAPNGTQLVTGDLTITDGQILANSAGTAPAPAYAFESPDTDMGMYKAGTDILGFSMAGAEMLTIYSAGLRTWDGAGQEVFRLSTDGTNSLFYGYQTGSTIFINAAGTGMYFRNAVPDQDVHIQTHDGTGVRNRIYIDGSADLISFYTHGGVNDIQFNNGDIELLAGGKLILDGISGGNDYIYQATADQINMVIASATEFTLGSAGFLVPNVYASTSANAANVYVHTDGRIYRSTSTDRWKRDIMPFSSRGVLDLTPVTFTPMMGNPTKGEPMAEMVGVTLLGLTAENVAEVFPEASILGEDGTPEAVDWNAVVAGLLAVVKDQESRIAALENL